MPASDNGFEAWVEVDGERLQEFDVKQDPNDKRAPVLGCWIPSASGKEFKIGFKLPKGQVKKHHHSFTVHMDGEIVEVLTGFVERDRTISEDVIVRFGEELMSDGNTIRTFEFGALEVTENDSDIGLAHEDLGEIEICLSSVSRLVRNKASCSTSKCGAARKTDRIHEGQKKKGLTHSIQLGEEKEYDGPELDSVKYVGCADVCSFQFWYRSMETLIADGKAPGRNPPVPVASSLSNASRESSHLAEAVRNRNEHPPDEDEGLEYVTPEPAPQQNQHTSTVPNVNPAATSGPPAAEQGVTQPDPTVEAIGTSGSPSKQGLRTREQARKDDRGVRGTGRVLRSQTLSESGSAHRSPSQRSNLSRGHTTAPQTSPALPCIPEARQPVEVIEISDDDEDLVTVKVDEGGPPPLAINEFNAENIDQSLLAMSIDSVTPEEPKRLAEGRPSAPTTCRCGATTPSTFSSVSLQRDIKLSPVRHTNSPGSQCAGLLKRKLVPSGIANISDDEDGTREDPLITALKARIAALQEKDKIMAGRMATQDEIANAQGEIANILAQERGLKPLALQPGRDKKRVKTEVLDD